MTTDDMALVREFTASHSEQAFETLVARHIGLVYSAALRQTRDPHLAEEITQAVFIILARKAGSLGEKTILSGWLYRTAQFVANDALKNQRRRQHREQEAYMQSMLHDSQTETAWRELSPHLEEAMSRLRQTDRNAVMLRYFENKSLREVGGALGLEERTAQKRIVRALERLRNFFAKRGVVLTTAVVAGAISANSIQAAPMAVTKSVTAVAAVKSAAVSASTLALVKGALKMMLWTKAKTAAITLAVVMLAMVGTTTVARHFRRAHPPQPGRLNLPIGNVTPMVGYGNNRFGIILASDGSLWSWGEERMGWPTLGLENTNIRSSPSLRRIGHEADWAYVSVGDSHCLAVKSDGTLWAWGKNSRYELGNGRRSLSVPTPVASVPGNDWKQAAAGSAGYSLALKKNGSLWAWGDNWAGQLGTGDTESRTNAVQVGNSTNWRRIWAGGLNGAGLQGDGSLWVWGLVGNDTNIEDDPLAPVRISADTNWVDLCFGHSTMFAIKSDGTLWCWGPEAHFYTQAQDANLNSKPDQVGTENNWQACAATGSGGYYHVLMKKDGTLWALDASDHRQTKRAGEYKPVTLRKINLQNDVVAFAAGEDSLGVMLTRNGEVWTWGMVIGEHMQQDYWGPNQQQLHPTLNIIVEPWQLSNIDSAD